MTSSKEGRSHAAAAETDVAPEPRTVLRGALHPRTTAVVWIAVVATILLLQFAQAVFIPIVLSALVSYALDPLVGGLSRLRIPRAAGAAIVIFVVTGVIGYGVYSLSDEAVQLVDSLPEAAQKVRQALHRKHSGEETVIEKVQRAATEIEQTAKEAAGDQPAPRGVMRVQVEDKPIDVRGYVLWGGSSIAGFVTQLSLVLFFVYFLLVSGDHFKRKLVKIAGPSLAKRRVTIQILEEISVQVERFLIIQVLACVVVAVISAAVFRWAGLEHSLLWAIASGLLVTIPYFGALIITVLVGLAAFMQFGSLPPALALAGAAFVIRGVETFLLTPWLMGRASRMSGVAVFAGLLFWGWLWGIWGMFLAVPMMVVMKSIFDRIEGLKPIGELMGD